MIRSQSIWSHESETPLAIDMAPLIDIVFILLVFFLVTTTFSRDEGIGVERPVATTSTPLPSVALRVHITKSGACFVGGQATPLAGIRQRVEELLPAGDNAAVVVVPDRAVLAGTLVQVLDEIAAIGVADVSIATRQEDVP
ncbi:MAG: biopolymer transporter ExbD [Planctomycetaceae bacterium]|nr:biopolymer transporter ExbD [Planctomycetaceae bacterium]